MILTGFIETEELDEMLAEIKIKKPKQIILDSYGGDTQSARYLAQFGRRLIAFNAPELLTSDEQNAFKAYLKNKWTAEDKKTEWTIIKNVKKQLQELEKNSYNISVLNDLKDFYKDRLANKKCLIEFD